MTVDFYLKKNGCKIRSVDDFRTYPDKYFNIVTSKSVSEIEDTFYIEGALVFYDNGKIVYGFEYWDLVDQLTAYFVTGIFELTVQKHVQTLEFYFPDQPVKVELVLREGYVYFRFEDHGLKLFPISDFITKSKEFFMLLKRTFETDAYDETLKMLTILKA